MDQGAHITVGNIKLYLRPVTAVLCYIVSGGAQPSPFFLDSKKGHSKKQFSLQDSPDPRNPWFPPALVCWSQLQDWDSNHCRHSRLDDSASWMLAECCIPVVSQNPPKQAASTLFHTDMTGKHRDTGNLYPVYPGPEIVTSVTAYMHCMYVN